jgi:ribosome-binding factor A
VTGVKVTPDLLQARVFVDIIDPKRSDSILKALRAATPVIRGEVAKRVHLRRVPQITFEQDAAIERGLRIEAVLAEIKATQSSRDDEPTE